MKTYKAGDEILPGLVYETHDNDDEHAVKFTGTGEINIVTTQDIEALESIAAELASLRARVPEWKTGVPDWDSLNPDDWMCRRAVGAKLGHGSGTVGWYRSHTPKSFDDWGRVEWLVVGEPKPSATKKPKELTVADLPYFDGRGKWVLSTDSNGETCVCFQVQVSDSRIREVYITDWIKTEHDAIQAALDAIAAGKLDRWLSQNKT